MQTSRRVAVEALLTMDMQAGYSNLVINNLIQTAALSPQDSAFASVLFYGVLERKLTLDHCIRHYSGKPLSKLTPAVREILRTALYQLLYLDHVPDSAAVNESVKLTRVFRCASASGFVNGVLRAFLRDGKMIPPIKGGRLEKLSVKYSCPVWLITQLESDYGREDTESLLKSFLGRQTLYGRVNTLKIDAVQLSAYLETDGIKCHIDDDLPDCIRLEKTGAIGQLETFKRGLFTIQDKACQLAIKMLAPKPGERILDVCSAPGSKSFTMAQLMEDQGEIIACDIYEQKIGLIADGAKRLGISIIHPLLRDGTSADLDLGQFDRILCDVPCSGFGVIGRKPEIRYKEPKELQDLPALQYKILENSSHYLKTDGILFYSTCTLNRRENEGVIEHFLKEHPDFRPLELPGHTDGYRTTLFPHLHGTDGFFFASMVKTR